MSNTQLNASTPPEPKPEAKDQMITLRHPGGLGDISFGPYRTEQEYKFNTETQAELIANLKGKGFLIIPRGN
jgi:hypothetical protein